MAITASERIEIRKHAIFLERCGYLVAENEFSISYVLGEIRISVVYPPHSDESDVSIRFCDVNQVFSIGWIALVRNNIKGSIIKLENVIELLKYVAKNYDEITQYHFCLESNRLIDQYVAKHRNEFDKAVSDFLAKQ